MTRRSSKPEPGRVLTLETIREKGACDGGSMAFEKRWGKSAIVNQGWAREASTALPYLSDAGWAARELLPKTFRAIYVKTSRDYYPFSQTGIRVRWAIFAALYVEAGKP